MLNNYEVLLLDIGDTLVHITEPFEVYTKQALRSIQPFFGLQAEDNQFVNDCLKVRNEMRAHAHETLIEPSIYNFFLELESHFGKELDNYLEVEQAYVQAELDITKVFPEALAFLLEAKENGFKIIAATNNFSPLHVQLVLNKFNLLDHFDELFISGEEGIRKPHSKFLEKLCTQYELNKNDCIMIGDKPQMDIEVAHTFQMDSVWINRKDQEIDSKYSPTFTVTSLDQLFN